MKNFIKIILITVCFSYLMGEIIVRIFDLNSDHLNIQIKDEDGYVDRLKNFKGTFRFGKFPSNFSSSIHINDIGFNSPLNFHELDTNLTNIAIVGDSYVESYHVDLEDNIASLLMKKNRELQVFPFGVSGYEFKEMLDIYNDFDLSDFKYVFFVLSKDDFILSPSKPKFNDQKEALRKIYNKFQFFVYLNSNHRLLLSIKKLFSGRKVKSQNIFEYTKIIDYLNSKSNVVVIPKFQNQYSFFKNLSINRLLLVDHIRKPFNYGFDSHWNKNGRINISEDIYKYINNN